MIHEQIMSYELCCAVGKPCATAKAEGGTRLATDGEGKQIRGGPAGRQIIGSSSPITQKK
jgi:hypothetical protein